LLEGSKILAPGVSVELVTSSGWIPYEFSDQSYNPPSSLKDYIFIAESMVIPKLLSDCNPMITILPTFVR